MHTCARKCRIQFTQVTSALRAARLYIIGHRIGSQNLDEIVTEVFANSINGHLTPFLCHIALEIQVENVIEGGSGNLSECGSLHGLGSEGPRLNLAKVDIPEVENL